MRVFFPWVSLQVYTTSIWFWITESLWLYDYSSPSERPINLSWRVSRGSHSDAETRVGNISRYLLGFRIQCDVLVHFQHHFKICSALSRFTHERLMSLFIVCQTMFTLGESRQFLIQPKENGKHKTTFHSTSGWESSLGKIYHRNSTAARTGTWNPARATKKTSSYKYIERSLSPRVNKHVNKAKWLWNTRLIQLIACMEEKNAVSILIIR